MIGEDFQASFVHMSEGVKDFNRTLINERIVPAALTPLQCFNDPWYLEGDATSRLVRKANNRTANGK